MHEIIVPVHDILRKLVKFHRKVKRPLAKIALPKTRPRYHAYRRRDLSPLLSQTSQSTISGGNRLACASDRVIASALNNLARPEDAGRHVDDRPEWDEEEYDEERRARIDQVR